MAATIRTTILTNHVIAQTSNQQELICRQAIARRATFQAGLRDFPHADAKPAQTAVKTKV
jgi:hypothetical protein